MLVQKDVFIVYTDAARRSDFPDVRHGAEVFMYLPAPVTLVIPIILLLYGMFENTL